jgi:hypothetical protein
MKYADEDMPDLGPCCICGATGPTVRTILMLNAKAPVRGHGWGCGVCGLPPHGASVVLCDACVAQYEGSGAPYDIEDALTFVCRGYPGSDGRLPIAELLGEHGHDWSKHPEVPQALPLSILKTDTRFGTHIEEGQGCHCSRCGQTIWDGVIALRVFAQSGQWQYRYHPCCFGALPMDEDPYTEYWEPPDDDA